MENGRLSNIDVGTTTGPLVNIRFMRSTSTQDAFITDSARMRTCQKILYQNGHRAKITTCGLWCAKVRELGDHVTVEFNDDKTMSLSGPRKMCRNRNCPLCNRLKGAKDIERIKDAFIAARNKGLIVEFYTFTKNYEINIKKSVDMVLSAMSKVNTVVKNFRNKKCVDVASMSIMEGSFHKEKKPIKGGYFSAANIGSHGLIFYPKELCKELIADLKQKMESAWEKEILCRGGYVFTREDLRCRSFDWKLTADTQDALVGLARYFNIKKGEKNKESTIGHELTSQHKDKKGRGLQVLLDDIVIDNRKEDVQMFVDYVKATGSRQTFRTTKRFRQLAEAGAAIRSRITNKVVDDGYKWVAERNGIDIAESEGLPDLAESPFPVQNAIYEQERSWKNELKQLSSIKYTRLDYALIKSNEELIAELNNKIRNVVADRQEQEKWQGEADAMEKDSKSKKVKDTFSFPADVWNALTWRYGCLWTFVDWLNVATFNNCSSKLLEDFKDWLKLKKNYENENRKIDVTVFELGEWIEKFRKLMGLTKPYCNVRNLNRCVS